MGTNFYFKNSEHIGKRSAAGLYCWDCEVPLVKHTQFGKYHNIHYSEDAINLDACPLCGNKKIYDTSATLLELGFKNTQDIAIKQTGVSSVSSFTWAMQRRRFDLLAKTLKIIDEYEREYSLEEFISEVIDKCPLHYQKLQHEFS